MKYILTLISVILISFSASSMEYFNTPVIAIAHLNTPEFNRIEMNGHLEFSLPTNAQEDFGNILLKDVKIHLFKTDGQELVLNSQITVITDEKTETECGFQVNRIHLIVNKLEAAPGTYFPAWLLQKVKSLIDDMEVNDKFGIRKKLEEKLNRKIAQALYLCDSNVKEAITIANPNKITEKEIMAMDAEIRADWLDRYGFMRLKPLGANAEIDNENPVLFTSEYIFFLKHLGFLKGEFRERLLTWIKTSIEPIRIRNSGDNSVVRGLFNRRPNDFGRHFSRDEQIGLITLDWAFDNQLGYCQELYDYGMANDWHYSNQTFEDRKIYDSNGKPISNKEALMASLRLPEFIGLVKACLGKELNYSERLQNLLGHGLDTKKENGTSGKILSLFTLEVMKEASEFDAILRAKYHQELRNTFQSNNPYEEIMNIYFLVNSPERPHPIIRLSRYMELEF